eukprot:gene17224-17414_t
MAGGICGSAGGLARDFVRSMSVMPQAVESAQSKNGRWGIRRAFLAEDAHSSPSDEI